MGHSSDDNEENNQIFRNAGADHILPKPSKLNLVKELLESIFWHFLQKFYVFIKFIFNNNILKIFLN